MGRLTVFKYGYLYSAFSFPIIALTQTSVFFWYRCLFYPSHGRWTLMVLLGVLVARIIPAVIVEIGFPGFSIDHWFTGGPKTDWNATYFLFCLATAIIELAACCTAEGISPGMKATALTSVLMLPRHWATSLQLLPTTSTLDTAPRHISKEHHQALFEHIVRIIDPELQPEHHPLFTVQ